MFSNRKLPIIALLWLCCFAGGVFAQSSEYTVKAVFLERFTRFIEWPEEAGIDDESQPFILTVLGNNPFGTVLEEIYSTKKIKNKSVTINYITDPSELEECHLLFISESNTSTLPEILKQVEKQPILIVADTKGYAESGVHINLYLDQEMIRFEINEPKAKEANIRISYLLLKTARIVNSP